MDGWVGGMSTPGEMTQKGEVPLTLAEWLVFKGFLDNHLHDLALVCKCTECPPGRGTAAPTWAGAMTCSQVFTAKQFGEVLGEVGWIF